MKKIKAGKKPANQGSAGKPNTMKPLMAKKASSKGGKTYFSKNPTGTRGSRSKQFKDLSKSQNCSLNFTSAHIARGNNGNQKRK